jgi:predicted MFS family arabinose efflux permease
MSLTPLTYLMFTGDVSSFYLPLIFVRILHGIGLAICFTSAFTYVADIIPGARLNEGLGMFGITGLMGLAIGPVIAEVIIDEFGFSTFFFTAAGMGTLGLLLHLPLPESYVSVACESFPSFFSILIKRKILTVALMALVFGFGLAAAGSFVAPFAEKQQLSFTSLYFVSYSSAAVITRLLGGRLTDRIGEDRIIPYALILTRAGLLILSFPGEDALLAVSGLMSGCGHGFLFPSLNSMAIRDEPINSRGKITGVFTGGIDAGAFVGSVMFGYIGDWAGFRGIFFAAGLALLIGLGIYRLRITRDW